jgi:hypothetical protein
MNLATMLFPSARQPPRQSAQADDRMMIRTPINMLFWNVIIVVGALVIYL